MYWEVFFDVETKKLFNEITTSDPGDLGVSIVSVYRRGVEENGREVTGEMRSFWESDFDEMWKLFTDTNRIIGFNTIKFDVPALRPYAPAYFAKLNHFDIMDRVVEKLGHRLSLSALVKDSLGGSKIAAGTDAVDYWNKGDEESLKKLKDYCEADVLLTRDLYDFGLKKKCLKYTDKWNNPTIVEIDFSYPISENPSGAQTSLW